MRLDLQLHSNKGALRSREDLIDLLRMAVDCLEQMPLSETRLLLHDKHNVRVGQLEIKGDT